MTPRIRWLAFWEWLANCPLLPRPNPRIKVPPPEPWEDCEFYGSAHAKVGQESRLDLAPEYRMPVRVFGLVRGQI